MLLFLILLCCIMFFFKQKTAYEMRISDWSSDVCSSDLVVGHGPHHRHLVTLGGIGHGQQGQHGIAGEPLQRHILMRQLAAQVNHQALVAIGSRLMADASRRTHRRVRAIGAHQQLRSEEHTSELQSLMRISYAVLCLKKKIKYTYNKKV